ncbi:redox-sensitive transcriptional activator SoxR [Nocardioides massiliensis]|uniref:MerR family redox-sensitive transcriptional activator SoxR n=1 Tax=Nocardioides massiliensis TaxID=1325935 RepID=A0ABT9NK01_9ACTN|nr:redox-sensitive transcriptional activator SoxR [Nocardioides massiliensis]MDP9820737.1 MerR family redox-sensitive transcriptional activator SoxR [Nocardioides massiliensis]
MPAAPMLTPGEVSMRAGIAISALHFYERQGLISSIRTAGNQRRYPRDVLRRLAFVRVAQRVGIPLVRVREELERLPGGRTPSRRDWQRLSGAWRTELEDRIRHLEQLRDDFTSCIGCGCLSLRQCALANPGDALGREGAGARRLLGPLQTDQR